LVGVMGEASKAQVWGYLANYVPDATPEAYPALDSLIDYAIRYVRDVADKPVRRAPAGVEIDALRDLDGELVRLGEGASAEDLQNAVYEIGKTRFGKEALRDWFKALYETLLGSEQGPRMGSFIALYGVDNSRKLVADALAKA
ncbi:MAG: lysine--tRNA ligase, partial [Sphingomonadales bacterium]